MASFYEAIRRRLQLKHFFNDKWGKSKHLASRYYPTLDERRKAKKKERQNRKAGR